MATISYAELLLGFVCLYYLFHWSINKNTPIVNWPVVGMLPGPLWNLPRIHNYVAEVLKQSIGTFVFKGPFFSGLDFVLTSDPMNTNHILSKSFPNYSKGPEFTTIFEPLGDGILAADSDSWRFQRKFIHSYLNGAKFRLFLEKTIQEKVANSLIPVLDRVCAQKMEVNMQDVFGRFGFDIICLLVLGFDPKCLSVDFPQIPYEKAFSEAEEVLLYRHVVPGKFWKLLKWLQIGSEKKLSANSKIVDDFVYRCIASKRDKMEAVDADFDFLTAYLMEEEEDALVMIKRNDNKFLRDIAINLLAAGRDTSSAALSWFFWLVATHESVESKILEEIKENLQHKEIHVLGREDVNKLVYLHAALCETLRLYPSVPINHKCAVQADTLPSGHHVKANTKIFISYYAMGRMEEIWGKDCYEFKPERWISEDGKIKHVASYKFTAFNAGPRSCLGKDMSFVVLKIVAVAIILKYHVKVVENHPVVPSTSVILHMKHGLKVSLTKRSV